MTLDLDLGSVSVPVTTLEQFNEDDPRRVASVVTNFGTWQLPPPAATVMGCELGHVQWAHDSDELFLIGAVPVPDAVLLSGSSSRLGGVYVPVEAVPAGTAIAVLATISHGWTAHNILWGWHGRQHESDGWDWLLDRLHTHRAEIAG